MLMPQIWTVTTPWGAAVATHPVSEPGNLGAHHHGHHHSHRGSVGGGGFWIFLVSVIGAWLCR